VKYKKRKTQKNQKIIILEIKMNIYLNQSLIMKKQQNILKEIHSMKKKIKKKAIFIKIKA